MTQQPPAAPTLHPLDEFTLTREQLETLQDYVGENYCRVNRTIAAHTIKDIYDAGCSSHTSTPDADARQRIEDVVKELEATLENTKKNVYGFNAEEAGWVGGYECGLEGAIALLKDGVERK